MVIYSTMKGGEEEMWQKVTYYTALVLDYLYKSALFVKDVVEISIKYMQDHVLPATRRTGSEFLDCNEFIDPVN